MNDSESESFQVWMAKDLEYLVEQSNIPVVANHSFASRNDAVVEP